MVSQPRFGNRSPLDVGVHIAAPSYRMPFQSFGHARLRGSGPCFKGETVVHEFALLGWDVLPVSRGVSTICMPRYRRTYISGTRESGTCSSRYSVPPINIAFSSTVSHSWYGAIKILVNASAKSPAIGTRTTHLVMIPLHVTTAIPFNHSLPFPAPEAVFVFSTTR